MRIDNVSSLLKQMGFLEEKETLGNEAANAKTNRLETSNTSGTFKKVDSFLNPGRSDRLDISNTSKAFKKVESFLNLGKPDRLDTADLNKSERKEFLEMIARLLKEGIVGYEILEVDGKPEKHFLVTQIGNERIKGAKLYNQPGYYDRR